MKQNEKTIIYTDLDGTFLDEKNYSYLESLPALRVAQESGVPVIFCSSMTRAEIEHLRKATGVNIMEKSKKKNYALWALQILLAAFYAIVATPKLMGNAEVVENFRRWGMPDKLYLLIGSLELLGAFGLLILRTTAWAAGGLILLMLCAAGTHIYHGELSMLPMPVITTLLLALVGYMRCPWVIKRGTTTEPSTEAEAR
jgi:uncharacterized membrane protein YphA (DoxX/SURF4 family)